jgi:phage shock protein PspC (stress-responsive transcriptional regulator)
MKRLYRSTEERKIAGVCGGLGEHFDLDPVFFRLVFLALLCFGGIGLLAYLAMWIMVPLKDAAREARAPGRLRRSRVERKIAGVCGGLGEFLEIDPVLFRVLFIVLAFMGGVGILLYIAFWLAMPDAVAADADAGRPGGGGGVAPAR